MRILLLCHAFNSLSQRLHVELRQWGHQVRVELDVNDASTQAAVAAFAPDLILAPFLKRAIPAAVWQKVRCIIVHPGIVGDRGPTSLDWAILNQETTWGVSCLQAEAAMDAGPVWASVTFPLRRARKSSLYRNEVTEAAVSAVQTTLERLANNEASTPLAAMDAGVTGQWRDAVRPQDREIQWSIDDTATVLRKIHSADGVPGVRCVLFGRAFHLYNATAAAGHSAEAKACQPGEALAFQGDALGLRTVDGVIWVGHLRIAEPAEGEPRFKLPARRVLLTVLPSLCAPLPQRKHEVPVVSATDGAAPSAALALQGREIGVVFSGRIGYLFFEFYNGAMSTTQCVALRSAYQQLAEQDVDSIVLMGGADFWSNGLHLNLIEAAESPSDESWQNIQAMNDLCEAIITTTDKRTVAVLRGNAGAGGVFLALACDHIYAREGIVLNPHYKGMGNLYGSEYWTYLLPKRVGLQHAESIMQARLPMGTAEAKSLGMIDVVVPGTPDAMEQAVHRDLQCWSAEMMASWIHHKRQQRAADEAAKPLADYRREELAQMHLNFFGFDPSYHFARFHFVEKIPKARTPAFLTR